MPRKDFVADLSKAVEARSGSIVGISEVQQGGDDGEFTFMCVADGKKLKISVLITGMLPVGSLLLRRPRHAKGAQLTFLRPLRLPFTSPVHDIRSRQRTSCCGRHAE